MTLAQRRHLKNLIATQPNKLMSDTPINLIFIHEDVYNHFKDSIADRELIHSSLYKEDNEDWFEENSYNIAIYDKTLTKWEDFSKYRGLKNQMINHFVYRLKSGYLKHSDNYAEYQDGNWIIPQTYEDSIRIPNTIFGYSKRFLTNELKKYENYLNSGTIDTEDVKFYDDIPMTQKEAEALVHQICVPCTINIIHLGTSNSLMIKKRKMAFSNASRYSDIFEGYISGEGIYQMVLRLNDNNNKNLINKPIYLNEESPFSYYELIYFLINAKKELAKEYLIATKRKEWLSSLQEDGGFVIPENFDDKIIQNESQTSIVDADIANNLNNLVKNEVDNTLSPTIKKENLHILTFDDIWKDNKKTTNTSNNDSLFFESEPKSTKKTSSNSIKMKR